MVEAINWVDPPLYQPAGYGLFSASQVLDEPDAYFGEVTWEQDACSPSSTWALCIAAGALPANTGTGTVTAAVGTVVTGAAAVTFTLAGFPAAAVVQIDPGDGLPLPPAVTVDGSGAGTLAYTYRNPGAFNASATTTPGAAHIAWVRVTLTAPSMPKVIPGPLYGAARSFAVLNGITCNRVGLLNERTRSAKRLALTEERQAEYAFMTGRASNYPYLTGPDTIVLVPSGGAALPLVDGLGWLEAELGERFGPQGVIHASRYMAPTFADHWLTESGPGRTSRSTTAGTPVAFGAGYPPLAPDGTTPAPTESWIYASGAITIRRSPVLTTETFDGAASAPTNQVKVVSERQYLIEADCPLLAVKVAVPSPPIVF